MKVVRIGICVLLAFQVLAFGGVEPWAAAILEIGAAILFLAWGLLALRKKHAEIHGNWLYLPLLGLGLLGVTQYIFHLSAYSYLTSLNLLKGAAYFLLCFLAAESFASPGKRNQLLWFLVIFGFLISFFAIVQRFTFNGRLYWSVPLRAGGSPFGPYVNRDDFAGLIELVAPLGFSLLLFRAVRKDHFPLVLLFTIVPVGASILSASRGGIIALLFELLLLFLLARTSRIGKRQIAGVAALVLIAGTFIVWLGVTTPIQRFELLTPTNISRDLRISIYRDTWHLFLDHPLAGTGLGTFAAVIPRYATFYIPGTVVDHAHNDYLELLSDTGAIGGVCGLVFLVLLFWRGIQNLRLAQTRSSRALHAGCLAACSGLLLHSLVDFNLQIPANALIFLVLASLTAVETQENVPGFPWKSEAAMGIKAEARKLCYRDKSSGDLPASQGFSQKSSDSQSP